MMRRSNITIAVVAGVALAGCRTPPPSFNPFAGYGSPRVPPPATGSYGAPNSYYPTTPPPGSTSGNAPFQQSGNTGTNLAAGKKWRPPVSTASGNAASNTGGQPYAVAPAGFNSPLNLTAPWAVSAANSPTTPGQQTEPSAAGSLPLKPMPVNDATNGFNSSGVLPSRVAAGQPPPVPAAPPAVPGSNPVRGLTSAVHAGVPAPGVVSPPIGPFATGAPLANPLGGVQPQSAASQPGSESPEIGWKPKYTPTNSGETIIR